MKRSGLHLIGIAAAVLSLAACAGVSPDRPLIPQTPMACPEAYVRQPFRAVHQIEMESARGGKNVFIGAVKAAPGEEALHAVLMSVEGMVLFEAELRKGNLRMISAFPPLNDPDFAGGLMGDVAFLLLKPAGSPEESGRDDQGFPACRWSSAAGGVTELAALGDGSVRMRRYDEKRRITREALAMPPFDRGMAARILLKAFRPAKYTIRLSLMEGDLTD